MKGRKEPQGDYCKNHRMNHKFRELCVFKTAKVSYNYGTRTEKYGEANIADTIMLLDKSLHMLYFSILAVFVSYGECDTFQTMYWPFERSTV